MALNAVIADVHGNLEALYAVLEDIRKKKADRIISLGDLAGRGPNQLEVMEIAMGKRPEILKGGFDINLGGNHENYLAAEIEIRGFPLEDVGVVGRGVKKSIRYAADRLLGGYGCPGRSGTIGVPPEGFDALSSDDYQVSLLKELLKETGGKHLAENLKLPKVGRIRLSSKLPFREAERIGKEYIMTVAGVYPGIMEEYAERITRRNRVLEMHGFLKELGEKVFQRIGSAWLGHDNPIEPGNDRYFLDEKTAKKEKIKATHMYDTGELLEKDGFGNNGIRDVFVGHSHVMPSSVTLPSGVTVHYVGTVGCPKFPRKRACYTLYDDSSGKTTYRQVSYDWETTARKLDEAGLVNIFRQAD